MKIWIEVELNWWDIEFTQVLDEENLSLSSFKKIWDLEVKLSEEYYKTTIEYNFFPFDFTDKKMDSVKNYLSEQINKYAFTINWDSPAFVWTHIHFFDRVRMNKWKLLNWVMSFILENIESISEGWLDRLIRAHQIWGFYSHRNWHFWANALNSKWFRYTNYDNSSNRNKYVPIFHSRATENWKPVSLEIRCIPNDFIFNWKIKDLLKEIEDRTILWREEVDKTDFFYKLMDKKLSFRSKSIDLDIELPSYASLIRSVQRTRIQSTSYYMDYSQIDIILSEFWEAEIDRRIALLTENDKISIRTHLRGLQNLHWVTVRLSRPIVNGFSEYSTVAYLIKKFNNEEERNNQWSDWVAF